MTGTVHIRVVKNRMREFRVHANRLGRLCIAWSNLEMDVTLLLSELVAIPDPVSNNTLLGIMDFRDKAKAVLAIGYSKRRDDKWFARLSKTINRIENEIRSERNRMVHDFWMYMPHDNSIKRANINPRVTRVQAFTLELQLVDLKDVSPAHITELCSAIEAASADVLDLTVELRLPASPDKLPPPTRTRSPYRRRAASTKKSLPRPSEA